MAEQTYPKGDYVVYGTSGVCLVEEAGPISFGNGSPVKDYYTLRPNTDKGSVIFVPFDNEALVSRIRPVTSKEDLEKLLISHLTSPMEWDHDRKARMACFREILSEGDLSALLSLIRCIYIQMNTLGECGKRLSNSDHDFLQTALHMIRGEFAFSLEIEPEKVEDYIRARLGKQAVI